MKATSVARRFRTALGSAILGITLAAFLAACGTPASTVATSTATATPVTMTATPATMTATPIAPTVVTPSPTLALPSPTATRTPPPPTPSVRCESFWRIEAHAWLDSDGNGQQDADEPPLAGVQFNVSSGSRGVSDETGQYVFRPITSCNPTITLSVAATVPDGYVLTTPGEVKLNRSGTAAFGFVTK